MSDIAVLLPSRGRVASLIDSVASLVNQAGRPDLIEILVAADPDDEPTSTYARKMPRTSCWIAPQRYGYGGLHHYFNGLTDLVISKHPRGVGPGWFLLWNDDARMLTENWDHILRAQPWPLPHRPDLGTLVADLWVDGHSPDLCTFPAVRRWAVQAVGSFSPVTCHCDTWWQDIGRALGMIRPVPIKVDHQRYDLTGHHNDLTYREGQSQYRSAEFYGQFVQGKLQEAIQAIKEAM